MQNSLKSQSFIVKNLSYILAFVVLGMVSLVCATAASAAITFDADSIDATADLDITAIGDLNLNGATTVTGNLTGTGDVQFGDIDANSHRAFASNYAAGTTAGSVFALDRTFGLGVLHSSSEDTNPGIFGATVGGNFTNVANYTSGTLGFQYAGVFDAWQNGLGSVMDHMTGISVAGGVTAGTATNYYGIRIQAPAKLAAGDITSQAIGLRVEDFTIRGFSAGTIDNIQSRGQTSRNWLEGKVAIGGLSSSDSITTQARITNRTAATTGLLINQASSATAENVRIHDSNGYVVASLGPVGASDARQQLFLYNTLEATPTNYERLAIYPDSGNNVYRIDSQNGGTGTQRNLVFQAAGGKVGIGTTAPSDTFDVNADNIRVRTSKTPASAGATCDQGEISWDSSFVYVCVATNTWKRSAIATW